MISLALRVPRGQGERTRRELLDQGALRTDLRIRGDGDFLLLPIRERSPSLASLGELVEVDFAPLEEGAGPGRYQDLVDLPAERSGLLPRAFDVVGDIVLVRVPPELEGDSAAIGAALLRFVPGARLVGADHGVHGPERLRSLRAIAGSGGWRTLHRENGITFEVDVERAYFSPRLAREHARVAALVRDGEVVYDLCCGIGPFAVTIARDGRARRVVAVDHNPAAIELLAATVERGRWTSRIEAQLRPVEAFLAGAGPCDRAILNLPHEGIKYLPSVARTVRPGGAIHYYEVVERSESEQREIRIVEALGGSSEWSVTERHDVHPYSPTSDVVGLTLQHAPARSTP